MRSKHFRSLALVLGAGTALMATPVFAAEVTPARLVNADKEPQNWLMNHRTYDGQRFSPLAQINKGNVKGLRLAYSVALGGRAGNEFNEATPLAEDFSIRSIPGASSTRSTPGRAIWVGSRTAFPDRCRAADYCLRKKFRIAAATASGACTTMMWPLSMIENSARRSMAA